MKKYKEGYILKENEYLLKTRGKISKKNPCVGFMTKFNQDGSMPKAFKEWGETYNYETRTYDYNTNVEIIEEFFRSGWKLNGWRIGKSQEWAQVEHPEGFIVEIYLDDFLNITLNGEISKGEIIGEYKWENKRLIKNK